MTGSSAIQPSAGWRLQPLVSAQNGQILGFEVLTAFSSSDLAERYFQQVSGPALLQVFAQQLDWVHRQGTSRYRYFCNLSVSALAESACVNVFSAQGQSGSRDMCSSVVVELQDPAALSGLSESALRQLTDSLRALRGQSVSLWLDDITPALLPVVTPLAAFFDGIKIDKGAFWQLSARPGRLAGFVSQCRALCPRVLIEGIETRSQRHQAIQAGADYLQGFLWPERWTDRAEKENRQTQDVPFTAQGEKL